MATQNTIYWNLKNFKNVFKIYFSNTLARTTSARTSSTCNLSKIRLLLRIRLFRHCIISVYLNYDYCFNSYSVSEKGSGTLLKNFWKTSEKVLKKVLKSFWKIFWKINANTFLTISLVLKKALKNILKTRKNRKRKHSTIKLIKFWYYDFENVWETRERRGGIWISEYTMARSCFRFLLRRTRFTDTVRRRSPYWPIVALTLQQRNVDNHSYDRL